jgi:multisubunit Na+/H+ antiporter MnhE subunit
MKAARRAAGMLLGLIVAFIVIVVGFRYDFDASLTVRLGGIATIIVLLAVLSWRRKQ